MIRCTPADRAATHLINRRLAHDGLLSTLAQTIELLGPGAFLTNGVAGRLHLNALGFPDDLLADWEKAVASEDAGRYPAILAALEERHHIKDVRRILNRRLDERWLAGLTSDA